MVLYSCVLIVFSLHRESLKLILKDGPLPEVVLSHRCNSRNRWPGGFIFLQQGKSAKWWSKEHAGEKKIGITPVEILAFLDLVFFLLMARPICRVSARSRSGSQGKSRSRGWWQLWHLLRMLPQRRWSGTGTRGGAGRVGWPLFHIITSLKRITFSPKITSREALDFHLTYFVSVLFCLSGSFLSFS
jgi:hypothetical protein